MFLKAIKMVNFVVIITVASMVMFAACGGGIQTGSNSMPSNSMPTFTSLPENK